MGSTDHKAGLTPEVPATSGEVPATDGEQPEVPAGEPEAPVGPTVGEPEPEEGGPDEPDQEEPERDHEAQLEHDLEELAAKAQKADEYLELAQRTRADFENYRKRAAREAAGAQERRVVQLVRELLPAVDNLDRAVAGIGSGGDGNELG